MNRTPLRPTQKTCNYGTCSQPVFSNGRCRYHREKKTMLKPKGNNRVYDNYGYKTEKDMFEAIYDERKPLVSEVSKRKITCEPGTIGWYMCFAHVLAKGSYPLYKLNPDNIMILHPEEHVIVDQGTEEDRTKYEQEHDCSFDVFYAKRKLLKEEYDS